jgi:hypothetical protein
MTTVSSKINTRALGSPRFRIGLRRFIEDVLLLFALLLVLLVHENHVTRRGEEWKSERIGT